MIAIDDEMKRSIEQLCGPRDFHDTRESWLARGARRAGISYRAAKAFFYREKINPRAARTLKPCARPFSKMGQTMTDTVSAPAPTKRYVPKSTTCSKILIALCPASKRLGFGRNLNKLGLWLIALGLCLIEDVKSGGGTSFARRPQSPERAPVETNHGAET
jgi:hypothetical protein